MFWNDWPIEKWEPERGSDQSPEVRSEESKGNGVSVSGDGKRSLSAPRWTQHRTAHNGWFDAVHNGSVEAWKTIEGLSGEVPQGKGIAGRA
jgi:hypothetical protein